MTNRIVMRDGGVSISLDETKVEQRFDVFEIGVACAVDVFDAFFGESDFLHLI